MTAYDKPDFLSDTQRTSVISPIQPHNLGVKRVGIVAL